MCRLSCSLGTWNSWITKDLSRPVMGLFYLYLLGTRQSLPLKVSNNKVDSVRVTYYCSALAWPPLQYKDNNKFCVYCYGTLHYKQYTVLHKTALIANLCRRQQNILRSLYKVSGIFIYSVRYLYIKCPLSLSGFNHVWSFSTHFYRRPQHHISCKSVQWESRWYMRTGGRADKQTNRRTWRR